MNFTIVLVSFCVILVIFLGILIVFLIIKLKEKEKLEKDIKKIVNDIFVESQYIKDSLKLLGSYKESQMIIERLRLNNQQLPEEKEKRRAYIMGYSGMLIVCDYIIAHKKQLKKKYDQINELVLAEIKTRNKERKTIVKQ